MAAQAKKAAKGSAGSGSGSGAKTQLKVCVGQSGLLVGELSYVKEGAREYSALAYDATWLAREDRFNVSPDLELMAGHQTHKAASKDDSVFPFALADTEPDSWGRRVIARAHAKARQGNPDLQALTALDYLCAADDFSRMGALRLQDTKGSFLQTVEQGQRATPPLLELGHMFAASRAVERSVETAQDLAYLQGKGTSLGGKRPKCTVLDEDGSLALGKFPSVNDSRSVTRGEILALHLAAAAGINAAAGRIVMVDNTPVAVVTRFDRALSTTGDHARIPYLSAASMLQALRNEERAYTEVVDVMRAKCADPVADARELWRRLVFNLLITNVDDHLHNLGFLHVGKGLWQLAPAFDLNPFPDKDRESKTWLSEDTGVITSIDDLMKQADYFHLNEVQARQILSEVVDAVDAWRAVGAGTPVGLSASELDEFAPAFEHAQMRLSKALLAAAAGLRR
jgi:serine/threonine-protein kinase HipA